MKLAANISLLYLELPLLQRIAAAARDGFDGVEIQYPYEVEPADLRVALQAAELPLALINTPRGPTGEPGLAAVAGAQPQFRDALHRALDTASATGCLRIHVMPGQLADAGDAEPASARYAVLVDNLRWAAPLARRRGIALTLEPLNRFDMPGYAYHRPAQALQVLQQVGEPNVGLQFDLYHVLREGLDLAQELAACRAWVSHVQIADAPARTEPRLDKPEVRAALQQLIGWPYQGWLGLEYRPVGATADSLQWMPALRRLVSRAPSLE